MSRPQHVLVEDVVDGRPVWRLTIRREARPGLDRVTTVEWHEEPTSEQLLLALDEGEDRFDDAGKRPGDRLQARKWGPLTWWSEVGPPPWRLPRLYVRPVHGMIRVGWRYTAYAVTWRWPWSRTERTDHGG